jgi:hypothetical protein
MTVTGMVSKHACARALIGLNIQPRLSAAFTQRANESLPPASSYCTMGKDDIAMDYEQGKGRYKEVFSFIQLNLLENMRFQMRACGRFCPRLY